MTDQLRPVDYHPDLSEERLVEIAGLLARARHDLAALHDEAAGDDGWSLGCRGFARCRNLLLRKSLTNEWEWLGIVDASKRFIFSVGSVPVRFYRGGLAKAPARTLAYSAEELKQLSLAFGDTASKDLKWRFAVETDVTGEPRSVMFAGLASDDGRVVCSWGLEFEQVGEIELGEINLTDMVELAPPAVDGPSEKRDRSVG